MFISYPGLIFVHSKSTSKDPDVDSSNLANTTILCLFFSNKNNTLFNGHDPMRLEEASNDVPSCSYQYDKAWPHI
jgi:hypothetical protein